MFTDAARAFLAKPLIARLSTLGADGYPHTVPLWFMLDGDDIVIISERATQKIRNLRRSPKAAVEIGGDPNDELGFLIRGDVVIADDVDHGWTERMTYHFEDQTTAEQHLAEWASLDMVVLRLTPRSVVQVWSN